MSLRFVLPLVLLFNGAVFGATTIEFWHPWPHAARTMSKLASRYKKLTKVNVHVRSFNPSTSLWTGQEQPDLIGISRLTKRDIERLAAAGKAYDLSSEMRRGWYTSLWPGMLETFRISRGARDGIYGVPLTGQVSMFVYNKKAFAKAGIKAPPRSWSALMEASKRLRKAGIVPYAGGFGSNMPPLAYAYEFSYLGLHDLSQTYFGYCPYTCKAWNSDLAIYPQMRRAGFTDAKWATMSEASAAKALIDGRVAMVFAGPIFESIRKTYKPRFKSWALFEAPPDARARFLPRLPGGVVEGVMVNPHSRNKAAAIAFTKWLTEPPQQVAFANGASSIPANPSACTEQTLAAHLRAFASGMRNQAVDLRVYEQPKALNALYSGVRGLLSGAGTPSSVAASAQRVKRR